jgi:hypothetical protein
VAGTETFQQILLFGKGQKAAGGNYFSVLNYQRAVMQRPVKLKNRDDEA